AHCVPRTIDDTTTEGPRHHGAGPHVFTAATLSTSRASPRTTRITRITSRSSGPGSGSGSDLVPLPVPASAPGPGPGPRPRPASFLLRLQQPRIECEAHQLRAVREPELLHDARAVRVD